MSNESPTFQVKEIATGKVIVRGALDAKEAVASGLYVYDHNQQIPEGKVVVPVEEPVDPPVNPDADDFNPNDIKRMNTEELTNLVELKNLEIDDFEKLNLKEKRSAVFEAMTGQKDD